MSGLTNPENRPYRSLTTSATNGQVMAKIPMLKSWPFSGSLTFNMAMCILSVGVFAEKLISLIVTRSLTPGGLMAVIWMVIAYHFVSVSYKGYKQERLHKTHRE